MTDSNNPILKQIQNALNESIMHGITRKIISCIRDTRNDELRSLALKVAPSLKQTPENLTGKKLLLLYHPDRITYYRHILNKAIQEKDVELQSSLLHLHEAKLWSGNSAWETKERIHKHSAPRKEDWDNWYSSQSDKEEYSYGREDFDDEYYKDFRHDITDTAEDEYENVISDDVEHESHTVSRAIEEAEYGNLDVHIEPHMFETLDGDLDLSSREIDDLYGIAYCKNIKSLNLSDNRIYDLREIAELVQLEELFLANNEIESVEDLLPLTKLRYLDLSDNPISDPTPLVSMESLEILVLENVSIPDDIRQRFTNAGIIVFT